MHLITKDRPSLLAKVGAVFSELNIQYMAHALPLWASEQRDIFYLSGLHGVSLNDDALAKLKSAIIQALS